MMEVPHTSNNKSVQLILFCGRTQTVYGTKCGKETKIVQDKYFLSIRKRT
jgi:hypothetical protein